MADPETYAVQYRAMVDRSLAHLNDALPEGDTWPLVTEFGAWGCECGFLQMSITQASVTAIGQEPISKSSFDSIRSGGELGIR